MDTIKVLEDIITKEDIITENKDKEDIKTNDESEIDTKEDEPKVEVIEENKDEILNSDIEDNEQNIPSDNESNTNNTDDSDIDDSNASNSMEQIEKMIYDIVNVEREKAGVKSLSYNNVMRKYARIKSKDMADNNYFDHRDLNGNLITTKMANDGVSYRAWGENIAYIQGVSGASELAKQFMTNWMNSSGHRANILSSDFDSIGVGLYKVGNRVYATQEFYK